MSYNNQLEYKADYGYADALLKANPLAQIAAPFEKIEATKSAKAKVSLDGIKTAAEIRNKEADTAGKLVANKLAPEKSQAEIELTKAKEVLEKSKTAGQNIINELKPKESQAEIELTKAKEVLEKSKTAGQNITNEFKPKEAQAGIDLTNSKRIGQDIANKFKPKESQAGIALDIAKTAKTKTETVYIGKDFELKKKNTINEISNRDAQTGQKAYSNIIQMNLSQAQATLANEKIKQLKTDKTTTFKNILGD